MTGFYRFALELTRYVFFLIYRVRFIGREKLPKQGGYVVACNHRSYADPIFVAHGIRGRSISYMAKAELFETPFLGRILPWLGVFPVARGTGDMSAVDHAIERLRTGGLLGIFPEGTRSKDGQPLRFKSGMAHIAKTAEVGVIPCVIRYSGKLGFWRHIEVEYGDPISYSELFGDEQSAAALKRATKLVRSRIYQMLGLVEEGAV